MTLIDELKILLFFIRNSDKNGNIDFTQSEITFGLYSLGISSNLIDNYLYEKTEEGIIHYEEIGEDGFAPIIMASTTAKTHPYISKKIEQLEADFQSLENRITAILTFNPSKLSNEITETLRTIKKVENEISKNPVLVALKSPLAAIVTHFDSVKKVSESYEEIYKNIIKPVQDEGKAGIKATVKWAIISLIASAVISILISNWDKIFK
jgi:hypothetical protein